MESGFIASIRFIVYMAAMFDSFPAVTHLNWKTL